MGFSEVSFATVAGKGTFRFIYNFYFLHMEVSSREDLNGMKQRHVTHTCLNALLK